MVIGRLKIYCRGARKGSGHPHGSGTHEALFTKAILACVSKEEMERVGEGRVGAVVVKKREGVKENGVGVAEEERVCVDEMCLYKGGWCTSQCATLWVGW